MPLQTTCPRPLKIKQQILDYPSAVLDDGNPKLLIFALGE
jgi:hypothetical protein